jgi:hypothetical protein
MNMSQATAANALIECHASGGHRNLATTSALDESTLHGAPLVWRRATPLNKTTSGPAASIGSATAGFHPRRRHHGFCWRVLATKGRL